MARKGGNTKSDINFKTITTTVRIPKPYHRACQEYALELERLDIENGNLYQNDKGVWVYKE